MLPRLSTPNPAPRAHLRLVTAALAVLLAGVLTLPAVPARAITGPWQQNEQSKVRLISPWGLAPAGGEWTLGLEFETIPGWHVYWKNSGDAGYPPAVDFAPTPEITGSQLLWPAPERYHLPGDLVALGYEGRVVYPVRVTLDPTAATVLDSLPVVARLDYLVCEVDCVPYSYELSLGQPLAVDGAEATRDPAMAELLATWQRRVPRAMADVDGVESTARLDLSDREAPALEVGFDGLAPAVGYEPDLFLEAHDTFAAGVPQRIDDPDSAEIRFRVPLSFRQVPDRLPKEADFAWTLTGTTTPDGDPVPLEDRRTVAASTVPPPTGLDPLKTPMAPSLPATLLWAFLGGLLLHLTPTVLPVSLLALVALARSSERPVAGPAIAAGIAAGCTALWAWAAGDPTATWGRQLQAPLPVAALTLLATLVALRLWGILRLPLASPRTLDGSAPDAVEETLEEDFGDPLEGGLEDDGGLIDSAGSFDPTGPFDPESADPVAATSMTTAVFTGLAVFALGLVWDLPPLTRSLGPALAGSGGSVLAVASVLALAAGLALPFLLVALLPGAGRPLAPLAVAPWPRRLAEAGGFLEAGSVLWLLYLLSRQVTGEGVAYVQLALLAVALVAWLRHTSRRPAVAAVLAVVLLALVATVLWLAASQALTTATAAPTPPTFEAPGTSPAPIHRS